MKERVIETENQEKIELLKKTENQEKIGLLKQIFLAHWFVVRVVLHSDHRQQLGFETYMHWKEREGDTDSFEMTAPEGRYRSCNDDDLHAIKEYIHLFFPEDFIDYLTISHSDFTCKKEVPISLLKDILKKISPSPDIVTSTLLSLEDRDNFLNFLEKMQNLIKSSDGRIFYGYKECFEYLNRFYSTTDEMERELAILNLLNHQKKKPYYADPCLVNIGLYMARCAQNSSDFENAVIFLTPYKNKYLEVKLELLELRFRLGIKYLSDLDPEETEDTLREQNELLMLAHITEITRDSDELPERAQFYLKFIISGRWIRNKFENLGITLESLWFAKALTTLGDHIVKVCSEKNQNYTLLKSVLLTDKNNTSFEYCNYLIAIIKQLFLVQKIYEQCSQHDLAVKFFKEAPSVFPFETINLTKEKIEALIEINKSENNLEQAKKAYYDSVKINELRRQSWDFLLLSKNICEYGVLYSELNNLFGPNCDNNTQPTVFQRAAFMIVSIITANQEFLLRKLEKKHFGKGITSMLSECQKNSMNKLLQAFSKIATTTMNKKKFIFFGEIERSTWYGEFLQSIIKIQENDPNSLDQLIDIYTLFKEETMKVGESMKNTR